MQLRINSQVRLGLPGAPLARDDANKAAENKLLSMQKSVPLFFTNLPEKLDGTLAQMFAASAASSGAVEASRQRSELRALQCELKDAKEAAAAAKGDAAASQKRASEAESASYSAKAALHNVQEEYAAEKAKCEALNSDLTQLRAEVAALQQRLSAADAGDEAQPQPAAGALVLTAVSV